MNCPSCETKLYCVCKKCLDKNKYKHYLIWEMDKSIPNWQNLQYCSKCRFTQTFDEWVDLKEKKDG